MGRKGAKARAAQRRNDALELRKAGASYRQIAQQTGVSHTQAHNDVTKAIADLAKKGEEDAQELRTLEAARLDALFLSVWQQARAGDLKAMDRCLRIMARRAKMLGLDAPEQHWLSGTEGKDLFDMEAWGRERKKRLGEAQGLEGE